MKMKKIMVVLLSMCFVLCLFGGQNVMFANEGMPSDIQKVDIEKSTIGVKEPSLSQAEPQATMAPLPEGDYADIYIQAIKACGYKDASTFGKDFLALDFGTRPKLDEEDIEKIQTYFQELGYTVYVSDYDKLEQQGLAVYESETSGKLKLVNGVMIKIFGMGQTWENRMCLSVHEGEMQNEHFLKEMDFVKKGDRWIFDSITYTKWCGDGPNPYVPALPIQSENTEGMFKYKVKDGAATLTKYIGEETESVVIPDTLGGYPVKVIGESAFHLAKVKKVMIPEGVTLIKREAFSSAKLREVIIPESVTTIETQAFYASSLTEIAIPKGVSAIGDLAFSTISLKKVTVDAENEYFVSEDNVLFTKDKKELVLCTYPDRKGTFSVPEGVTVVRSHAFLNCVGITKIVLPDTLKTIGDAAFAHTGITELVIPEHVVCVEDFGFDECHNLKKVYYMGNAPEFEKGIGIMSGKFTIFYLNGTTGWDEIEWNGYAHEQKEQFYKKGDVNGDQKVDLNDARSALKIALALDSADAIQRLAADVVKDGMISLKDAQKILRAALNIDSI